MGAPVQQDIDQTEFERPRYSIGEAAARSGLSRTRCAGTSGSA